VIFLLRTLRRVIKYPLIILLLTIGLFIAVVLFPVMSLRFRGGVASFWHRSLLLVLRVRVIPEERVLWRDCRFMVGNHVSWLDIPVLSSMGSVRFLSKSEVRSWPVIGFLSHMTGTVFINRSSRSALRNVNREIGLIAQSGGSVFVFPEGTTTRGADTQPFHASVFQAAIDSHVNVNPVLIQYLDLSGAATQLAAYVDDMSLLTSLDHIICSPGLQARLVVFDSLDFQNQGRQQLAERSRDLIQSELIQ
jgi:1-acyl-sn-glycerol-3-phosphate acyltransferase